ncbi:unnamed protein product [Moneuplotes crassus]|uniref:Secreted protein n=1 Tax=Euplotes crassus TaxID=5936 RepID=A0AAD1Y0X9_EUPCR|nr:unnamed protein product [Moneuplotes crassus]
MKLILPLLILTTLLYSLPIATKELPDPSSFSSRVTKISYSTWDGFMKQYHYAQGFTLPEDCLSEKFEREVERIVVALREEESCSGKVKKVYEGLVKIQAVTYKNCLVPNLVTEIKSECNKHGCDIFTLSMRLQQDFSILISLYNDILDNYYQEFDSEQSLYNSFKNIGIDIAKITHIILGMRQ